jgi:hypothetical protein
VLKFAGSVRIPISSTTTKGNSTKGFCFHFINGNYDEELFALQIKSVIEEHVLADAEREKDPSTLVSNLPFWYIRQTVRSLCMQEILLYFPTTKYMKGDLWFFVAVCVLAAHMRW